MKPNKANLCQALSKTSHHTSGIAIETGDIFFKKLYDDEAGLYRQTHFSYVTDHSQNKFSYVESSCKKVLGYTKEYIIEAGPRFFKSLMHKSDLKVYDSLILPEIVQCLKRQHTNNHADFSFSYNYRIKMKENNYLTVLQRSAFLLHQDTGDIIAEYGSVTDITYFKEDTKIIFTVERVNTKEETLHKGVLSKSVYLPHSNIFSRREREILQLIYQGAGSRQIAEKLFVSINTVNNHRKNMLNKTGTKNFIQLIAYAIRNGFIGLFYFGLADYPMLCA